MSSRQDWGTYKNARGIEFFLQAEEKTPPAGANYRLWWLASRRGPDPQSPALMFWIFVTHASYPSAELATHVARGPALDHIKGMLETATEKGRLLDLSGTLSMHEGWAVV